MKILRITLENFQGLRKAEFSFNGKNANIYGDNAVGKTTVYNAFTWLLFGNSSTGAKDYNPKTKTEDGDAHNLDHSVECEMEIDGENITFKRVFREVWKKTKGNLESNLSGHTTDYFINGVPKKEKEYSRYWEDIFANDELPKLLSMPFYFPETLHWEKRRAILLEICGVISDHEIMQTDDELKILAGLVGKNTVYEYKKIVKASLTEINRTMQSIPARIDEAQKAMPDWSEYVCSPVGIDEKLADIRNKIWEAEKERAALLSSDNSALLARKVVEFKTELEEARNLYSKRMQAENSISFEAVREVRSKITEADKKVTDCNYNLEIAKNNAFSLGRKRNEILENHRKKHDEYKHIQAIIFEESSTICVTCGQNLPPERAEELREAFNVDKSRQLETITNEMERLVEKGKNEASKEMLANAQETVSNMEKSVEMTQNEVNNLMDLLRELEANQNKTDLPPFEHTEEYKNITDKINKAKTDEAQSAPDTSEIDNLIDEYRREENGFNSVKAAVEAETIQKARIAELEKQEQELGKSYEETGRSVYLCEKFSRVKAALLTDKINERFKSVSFQLFKKNITNDGIDDVCEVLIPTDVGDRIPFPLANNAARINAGLEIISVLGEHYGVELPVFVDNAESVTRIISINSQLIRLIVSEKDKQLRLELL